EAIEIADRERRQHGAYRDTNRTLNDRRAQDERRHMHARRADRLANRQLARAHFGGVRHEPIDTKGGETERDSENTNHETHERAERAIVAIEIRDDRSRLEHLHAPEAMLPGE